ncbi:MAG TPA: helix-turn-helix transcriptional regulator [Chloroflexota bacterium]|nr:helix-turn-helix transcriptional regulator [Chloroflexota bacterium]
MLGTRRTLLSVATMGWMPKGHVTPSYPLPTLGAQRVRLAWSQEELAKRSGVSRPAIARIETGTGARISTVRKLADALGVSPAELMRAD